MEKKMKIVKWLADNGYHFFGETLVHFALRFDLETLKAFKKCFANQKGIAED